MNHKIGDILVRVKDEKTGEENWVRLTEIATRIFETIQEVTDK